MKYNFFLCVYRFYVHTDNNNDCRNAKCVMHECEKFNANMLNEEEAKVESCKKKETSKRTHNANVSINCRTSIVRVDNRLESKEKNKATQPHTQNECNENEKKKK